PELPTVTYRAVSRQQNAEALAAIVNCLRQPGCDGLLGERLECGPFLWRQLAVPGVTNATVYTLPLNVGGGGSQDFAWQGRRCENYEQVRTLWRALGEKVPQKSLQRFRSLNHMACRTYAH